MTDTDTSDNAKIPRNSSASELSGDARCQRRCEVIPYQHGRWVDPGGAQTHQQCVPPQAPVEYSEYRRLFRSHWGLSRYEVLFAPWYLRTYRRATVIYRDFLGLPRKVY